MKGRIGSRVRESLSIFRLVGNLTGIASPKWEEVRKYLEHVCIDLPYSLNLEHVSTKEVIRSTISAQPLSIEMPPQLERTALRIPVVDDGESGLERRNCSRKYIPSK